MLVAVADGTSRTTEGALLAVAVASVTKRCTGQSAHAHVYVAGRCTSVALSASLQSHDMRNGCLTPAIRGAVTLGTWAYSSDVPVVTLNSAEAVPLMGSATSTRTTYVAAASRLPGRRFSVALVAPTAWPDAARAATRSVVDVDEGWSCRSTLQRYCSEPTAGTPPAHASNALRTDSSSGLERVRRSTVRGDRGTSCGPNDVAARLDTVIIVMLVIPVNSSRSVRRNVVAVPAGSTADVTLSACVGSDDRADSARRNARRTTTAGAVLASGMAASVSDMLVMVSTSYVAVTRGLLKKLPPASSTTPSQCPTVSGARSTARGLRAVTGGCTGAASMGSRLEHVVSVELAPVVASTRPGSMVMLSLTVTRKS
eukprot:PhM_4_TR16752/c1_g2_i4/m.26729